jgi:hypothetical protein
MKFLLALRAPSSSYSSSVRSEYSSLHFVLPFRRKQYIGITKFSHMKQSQVGNLCLSKEGEKAVGGAFQR